MHETFVSLCSPFALSVYFERDAKTIKLEAALVVIEAVRLHNRIAMGEAV